MTIYFDRDLWNGATKPVREMMDNPLGFIIGGGLMILCCLLLPPACIKFKRPWR